MYFSNSHASRDLPMPAMPGDEHQLRALLLLGGVEEILDELQLAVATDERRLEPGRAHRAAPARDDAQRAPELHRLRLALHLVLAGVLVGDRGLGRALRRLAREHGSGLGCRLDAEAVLTRSPATMPWFVAPSVTAASPVRIPARARSSGLISGIAAARSSAALTARSASSSCATGAPQTAITASPMNFSTVPP